jgi:molybdopterin-guanine dinucleotide biosynthesis protein A
MNPYFGKYSGILLAGGKSSRMGEDKAFIKFRNLYLFEYSLSILKQFSNDIIISSSNPRFDKTGFRRVEDKIPGLGPISGLYSCLKEIKFESAIVLPCDLPKLSNKTIEILINNSTGFDITIALNHQNIAEPLVGIYSSVLIPKLELMMKSGNYKVQDLIKSSTTNKVRISDASSDNFLNMNSPADLNSLT